MARTTQRAPRYLMKYLPALLLAAMAATSAQPAAPASQTSYIHAGRLLADVTEPEHVSFVMKDGVTCKGDNGGRDNGGGDNGRGRLPPVRCS